MLTVLAVLVFQIPYFTNVSYTPPRLSAIIANLLLVQNLISHVDVLAPLWSLPLEVQMYLLLPIVFLGIKRWRSFSNPIVLVAVGVALKIIEGRLARLLGYTPLLTYSPWFFMGIVAFSRGYTARFRSSLYAPVLLLFLALCYLVPNLIPGSRSGWVVWAIGFSFAWLLPGFRQVRLKIVRIPAKLIARYSYGVYLSHVPILWFAFRVCHFRSMTVAVGITAMLIAIIPPALYHLVEEPMMSIGARIAGTIQRSFPASASTAVPSKA
jgi:peptidoglycan/LPS O-acetylase OafA/YrhL